VLLIQVAALRGCGFRCSRNANVPVGSGGLALHLMAEQGKGNRRRRDVTCIIRVQMVSAVVKREESRRVTRIPHNRVEIDHGIEFGAAQHPLTDLLTNHFLSGVKKVDLARIEERVLEWRVRRPHNANPLFGGRAQSAGDNRQ
jgi:hypothetical protein